MVILSPDRGSNFQIWKQNVKYGNRNFLDFCPRSWGSLLLIMHQHSHISVRGPCLMMIMIKFLWLCVLFNGIFRQVLHTPCPEIWHGQLHMYFSGLKENQCSCSHLKSQALNFGTRSMKYIVHGLSYVDIIQKKIRDMKCEAYCPCHILRDI